AEEWPTRRHSPQVSQNNAVPMREDVPPNAGSRTVIEPPRRRPTQDRRRRQSRRSALAMGASAAAPRADELSTGRRPNCEGAAVKRPRRREWGALALADDPGGPLLQSPAHPDSP